MSTPEAKEAAAAQLLGAAAQIESVLDPIVGWSRSAWRCPAGDGFEIEVGVELDRLRRLVQRLRDVAGSLQASATAQRLAELAAAEAAAARAAELRTGSSKELPLARAAPFRGWRAAAG